MSLCTISLTYYSDTNADSDKNNQNNYDSNNNNNNDKNNNDSNDSNDYTNPNINKNHFNRQCKIKSE